MFVNVFDTSVVFAFPVGLFSIITAMFQISVLVAFACVNRRRGRYMPMYLLILMLRRLKIGVVLSLRVAI